MDNDQPPAGKTPSPPPSLPKALEYGALLIFIDAFFLNQGGLSILVAMVVLLRALHTVFRYYFFKHPFFKQQLRNYAIYVAAVVLVWGLNFGQNILAHHRAENVVASIEAYHAKYGDYPQSLETMVPEFLDNVPLAKYTFISYSFFYRKTKENKPYFFYMIFPPYYRNFYNFEKQEWRAMD
jgi:hypothetical protein